MKVWREMILAGALALLATPVQAAIVYIDLATAAPPGTLGGYTMMPFPDDPRTEFDYVGGVPLPGGGTVDFGYSLNLREVGIGWSTWSNGYTGDVYTTEGSAVPLTLTLSPGVDAFYLYVEPDPFDTFSFNVCSLTTCSGSFDIAGTAGARGFGFYGTAGDQITSITINSLSGVGFGVGEFGISTVPEPGTMVLIGVGALGLIARRRRRLRDAE